jgi:hypothetical protein
MLTYHLGDEQQTRWWAQFRDVVHIIETIIVTIKNNETLVTHRPSAMQTAGRELASRNYSTQDKERYYAK